MMLISPAEDHAIASTYAFVMTAKPSIRATRDQIFLGACGELAMARFLGVEHFARCREHLLREDASLDDYRFDLLGRIDVKTAEQKNRNLVVNRIHPDVRYVLLRATRAVSYLEDPCDLVFEFVGWSPGDPDRFEPFRLDPKKSFQHADRLLPFSSLMTDLLKDLVSDRKR